MWSGEEALDGGLESFGASYWSKAKYLLAITRDEELCKVPLDPITQHARGATLEEGEDWVAISAVDSSLLHHGEGHSVAACTELRSLESRLQLLR